MTHATRPGGMSFAAFTANAPYASVTWRFDHTLVLSRIPLDRFSAQTFPGCLLVKMFERERERERERIAYYTGLIVDV